MSVPFSIQAGDGDQCDAYSSWFGDIFFNESNVHIFDPYIINNAGLSSLSKYYLPRMKERAKVFIYSDICNAEDYSALKNRLDVLAAQFNVKFSVFNRIQSLHGRHIFIGLYHVVLDHGLDFLDAQKKKVTDCSIELKKEADDSLLRSFQKKFVLFYEAHDSSPKIG